MKKILTIILILVAAISYGQNKFLYPTIFYNDVYITDSLPSAPSVSPKFIIRTDSTFFTKFGGDGTKTLIVTNTGLVDTITITTSAGLQDVITNDNVLTTNNTIDVDGNNLTISNAHNAIIGTSVYPDGFLAITDIDSSISIGDVATQVNGTTIQVKDGTATININANNGIFFSGDLSPSSNDVYNLGGNSSHIDTGFFNRIFIDGGFVGAVLTSDVDGNGYWQQASGVYLPDTSDGIDITDFVIDSASYTRVGNVVAVTGYISNVSSTALQTPTIELSLPISSNLARVGQLTGQASVDGSTFIGAYIIGNTTSDKAVLHLGSNLTLSNNIVTFTFSYLVY